MSAINTQVGTDISLAVSMLSQGKLVAMPTETVYGLAGNALDARVVASIFEAKARPAFDPLIVHVSGLNQLSKYVDATSEKALRLAALFWPGPLTLLFQKKSLIPDLVTSGHETVAIRIPNHPLALRLLQAIDFPLAAPSANPFGYVSPTTAQHVCNQLQGKVHYILDGGACSVGLESTIVSFEANEPKVLRLGGLPLEAIEDALGEHVAHQLSSSSPQAPGMLVSHYNPGKKVVLDDSHLEDYDGLGYLRFSDFLPHIEKSRQYVLSPNASLLEAAQNLFAALRFFDQQQFEKVVAQRVPNEGLGRAINDRLARAAN